MRRSVHNDAKTVICLVIPSLQAGGMERVMSEIATFFSRREELETHLVLYGKSRETFYNVPENIITTVPTFRFNSKWRLFYTLKTILFLRKTIMKINPGSILSFGEIWNSFVLLSLFGLRYPVFVSDRCQPGKKLGKINELLRRILYPRASGIIAQTQRAEEFYRIHLHFNNIKVIGNPIKTINNRKNIVRENIVLSVGRLIDTKHHDRLIELFTDISMPGWQLVIVGYDHLKQNTHEKLKRIIDLKNAGDYIKLEGKQTDVEAYYLKSKIFASASSSEGFPNAIGEAMSAGLPVIAIDCVAGPSELITGGLNGFLIPVNDYDLFKEKLEVLMSDEQLREQLGTEARKSITSFSPEAIGSKYLDFILGR